MAIFLSHKRRLVKLMKNSAPQAIFFEIHLLNMAKECYFEHLKVKTEIILFEHLKVKTEIIIFLNIFGQILPPWPRSPRPRPRPRQKNHPSASVIFKNSFLGLGLGLGQKSTPRPRPRPRSKSCPRSITACII